MRGIFIIILILKRNKQVFIGLTQKYIVIAGPKKQAMRNSDLEVKKEANIITEVKVKKSLIVNNS